MEEKRKKILFDRVEKSKVFHAIFPFPFSSLSFVRGFNCTATAIVTCKPERFLSRLEERVRHPCYEFFAIKIARLPVS